MLGRTNRMWWGAAIEAPDPLALATFYSSLLDWPIVHHEPGTAVMQPPQEGVFIVFQQADDYVAPVLQRQRRGRADQRGDINTPARA